MGAIADIYPGSTRRFSITLKIDGSAQDIQADVVTFRMKAIKSDPDSEADLTAVADVAAGGASGIAIFELTPSQTEHLVLGDYFCDIIWEDDSTDRVYVAYDGTITIKERVSDA